MIFEKKNPNKFDSNSSKLIQNKNNPLQNWPHRSSLFGLVFFLLISIVMCCVQIENQSASVRKNAQNYYRLQAQFELSNELSLLFGLLDGNDRKRLTKIVSLPLFVHVFVGPQKNGTCRAILINRTIWTAMWMRLNHAQIISHIVFWFFLLKKIFWFLVVFKIKQTIFSHSKWTISEQCEIR